MPFVCQEHFPARRYGSVFTFYFSTAYTTKIMGKPTGFLEFERGAYGSQVLFQIVALKFSWL